MKSKQQSPGAIRAAIVVAALGYFVDIYDLILFGMVRKPSLIELGVPPEMLKDIGGALMNWQMGGMLLGGILWGMLGDMRGRLSVLFGSILLYSVANIANGAVSSIETYEWLRFIAGIGLAGELGAGITLVSEIMHKERRGYGTTIVASVGILGAVAAWLVSDTFGWRNAFYAGGVMGLLLLILRIGVYESGMYASMKESSVSRGNFLAFFSSGERFLRYMRCILIGVPLWFVVGILVLYAAEFGKALGITPEPDSGFALMICYVGLAAGDLASGLMSQWLRSRKKVVVIFLGLEVVMIALYLLNSGGSATTFYALCAGLGFASGYWAVFVTIASEQFGTNVRATATTTVPNFVRGMVVPLNLLFLNLSAGSLGMIETAAWMGAGVLMIAYFMARGMQETYGKDLDYLEGLA